MRLYIKGDYTKRYHLATENSHGRCGLKKEMVKK